MLLCVPQETSPIIVPLIGEETVDALGDRDDSMLLKVNAEALVLVHREAGGGIRYGSVKHRNQGLIALNRNSQVAVLGNLHTHGICE